jgi:hypothetical protein
MMTDKDNMIKDEYECACGCGTNFITPILKQFNNFYYKEEKKYLNILTGCRCEKYNRKIKSSYFSEHLSNNGIKQSTAIDVGYNSLDERSSIIFKAIQFGICRIIVHPNKNLIHLSVDKNLTNPLILFVYRGNPL